MKSKELISKLDLMIPNPRCELDYNKDYELLIAVVLSAQCTDKRVNMVTKELFKYSLRQIAGMPIKDIEKIIHSLGSYTKKSLYVKQIASILLDKYDGKIVNDRNVLESLPGVGRKSANVVLSELFNVPTIAVDTHVTRVAKRLELASENDNVNQIEKKLNSYFDKDDYNKVNHQLVLFGRYICTALKPNCEKCTIKCRKKDDI